MGGRGSGSRLPKGSGEGRLVARFAKEAKDWSGNEIDLRDSPLAYGDKDTNLSDAARKAVEEFENKRVKAKIEFGMAYDANGVPVEKELRGGHGSVKPTWRVFNYSEVFSHNHPRSNEPGRLGGTFSDADLSCFTDWPKMKTMRATASEGTYSISKKSNFDAAGFRSYVKQIYKECSERHEKAFDDLLGRYHNPTSTMTGKQYREEKAKLFNQYLVDTHNQLRAGAKKYGYDYTLERR